MPWIVRFTFQDKECLDIQAYDLFKNQDEKKEAGMMKNRLSQRLPLLGIALIIFCAFPALADTTDQTGNLFLLDRGTLENQTVNGDVYAANNTIKILDCSIGGDLIAAGNNITVDGKADSGLKGNLRTACNNLFVDNVTNVKTATSAGNRLHFGSGYKGSAVYAVGREVIFEGECIQFSAFAETVRIRGKITGSADISAQTVIFEPSSEISSANVTTTNLEQNPAAQIGTLIRHTNPLPRSAYAKFIGALAFQLFWVPACALLALLLCLLCGGALSGAADMLKKNPVKIWIAGLIALIGLPFATLFAALTIIGLPAALLLLLLYLLLLLFAAPFTGASFGRFCFPSLPRAAASVIGAAILSIALILPVLNLLLWLGCFLYTAGYFALSVIGKGKKEI